MTTIGLKFEKNHFHFYLLLIACLLIGSGWCMRKQGAAVKGKLRCGHRPLENVLVRLVDTDTGPDPDDTLDSKYTDAEGHFHLDGTTRELSTIDPLVYIWHDCNDKENGVEKDCQRKVTFKVPEKFIHRGTASEVLDFGELNMEMEFAVETRECSH